MATDRLGNFGLNATIVVLGVVMVGLVWSLIGGWVSDPDRTDESSSRYGMVQLDVRNGCGTSGLAGRMRDYLLEKGMDVVEAGDWTRYNVQRTVVLDRIGDSGPATEVLRALELDESRIRQEISPDYYLDVTLVIGCDYADLPPFREEE